MSDNEYIGCEPELFRQTRRVSRKERPCAFCKTPIKAGETYTRTFIVDGGKGRAQSHHYYQCPPTPADLADAAREQQEMDLLHAQDELHRAMHDHPRDHAAVARLQSEVTELEGARQ